MWRHKLWDKMKALNDIFTSNQTEGFEVFVPGKYVPYTRAIAMRPTKQSSNYFNSNNRFWEEMEVQLNLRGLSSPEKQFRMEDKEIYIYSETFLYGLSGGDTANYGKMIEDACQDTKTTCRLYKNDKDVVGSFSRTFSVDTKEEEGILCFFIWRDKQIRQLAPKVKKEKIFNEDGRSFTFEIQFKKKFVDGINALKNHIYRTMENDYEDFFSLVNLPLGKDQKVALDVTCYDCDIHPAVIIEALKRSNLLRLPARVRSHNVIKEESRKKINKLEIIFNW